MIYNQIFVEKHYDKVKLNQSNIEKSVKQTIACDQKVGYNFAFFTPNNIK